MLAIGINCIALDKVAPALRQLGALADKPLLVYPNSGEHYDAVSKTARLRRRARQPADQAVEWRALGVQLIGGCCRTTPQDIRAIAARCKK